MIIEYRTPLIDLLAIYKIPYRRDVHGGFLYPTIHAILTLKT